MAAIAGAEVAAARLTALEAALTAPPNVPQDGINTMYYLFRT